MQAISRQSFNELKNYLGVYLQQGRVILDSDWNENQDIAVSFLRRLSREALGDGSPNNGFLIDPVFAPSPSLATASSSGSGDLGSAIGAAIGACIVDLLTLILYIFFGPILFFLSFGGKEFEDFESIDGWSLSSALGSIRIGGDRPYHGNGFLRLSGHPGTVQITKTLTSLVDLSSFELAVYHFRMNAQSPGTMKIFIQDDSGNRSVWINNNPAFGSDIWLSNFAAPLDLHYRITTPNLPIGYQNSSYSTEVFEFGGVTPITWALSAGALPAGITGPTAAGTGDQSKGANLNGTPTAAGTFTFTIRATDAGGKVVTQAYSLVINPPLPAGQSPPLVLPNSLDFLTQMSKVEIPTGTPADLTRVRSYGFELYQDPANPLVWDLDDLRLGSTALQEQVGNNNFIIRGSQFSEFLDEITLLSILMNSNVLGTTTTTTDNPLSNIIDLLNTDFQLSEPSVENAGRMYVDGFPCLQVNDGLYSDQVDPNDPPLVPPPAGAKRTDTVYLDVWQEPVTWVDDPEIRETALGGPDTATRLRARSRVRVNQGGATPTGFGIGKGTLATEGSYTAQANRLYLVEVDKAGDIGTATFRWSDDNASTIQRVIVEIPPNSTTVTVEDASAFHAGDLILIRKEFGDEQHLISSVFGNVITLNEATGTQLSTLPAAATVPNFTTFALEDFPRIERWNAFQVAIAADPADTTVSGAIPLNDGASVRFGGSGLRKGDFWNFRTRYLAGDEASGLSPDTRIEQLAFEQPRGVIHRYATLATFVRDGSAPNNNQITAIQDRRLRTGTSSTSGTTLNDLTSITGTALILVGPMVLPPSALDAKFVIFLSADLFLPAVAPAGSSMTIQASFFNDQMTDPIANPNDGKIQDRTVTVNLARKPVGVEVPLSLLLANSDTSFLFLPATSIPTSVQIMVKLSTTGFSVSLTNIQVTALELKKSF